MNERSTRSSRSGLIVANPAAGSVSRRLVRELTARCDSHLPRVLVRWTSARGDAARAVRDAANTPEPPDGVVAVGGDGTVLELAEGLLAIEPAERRPALFVVPAGTGNSNYL